MTLDLSRNHFELFGLPQCFALDLPALEQAYRDLQAESHPDRFAHAGDAEQRRAAQWSARINEAYKSLKTPFSRACYLLELQGIHAMDPANTQMPPDFLMQQMAWREALGEAVSEQDEAALQHLESEAKTEAARSLEDIGALLDKRNDYPAAAEVLRKYRFLEKFLSDIDDAYEELG